MENLKLIRIDGKADIYFDDGDVTITTEETQEVETTLEDLINQLINQGNFTENEKERIMDMSLRDFVAHCNQAKEATTPEIDEERVHDALVAKRKEVICNMGRIVCPHCGTLLRTVDGRLMCPSCLYINGDIDDLTIYHAFI